VVRINNFDHITSIMDESILLQLIGIAVLILISAFFSGAETGLTALSKAKIYKLKMGGDKRADLVTRLRGDKDALIGTLLLGNNAINILASALATSLAIHLYGDKGVLYSTIIMTVLVLVFAEVMPKTYAFYNAEKVSLSVAKPLSLFVMLLSPITKLVQVMVDAFMGLFGVNKKNVDTLTASDELRGAIEMHHHEGRVVKRERDMLGSVLDLTETEVGEIMVHRKKMLTVNIDQTPAKLIAQVLSKNHTRIPVWKERPDNIIGLLHTKSILKLMHRKKGKVKSNEIMKTLVSPWFVPETNTLSNQLLQFRKKRMHMAIVVDEYGDLVGLVTLEDILEEIVGQIDDEHDQSSAGQIKKSKDGYVEVSGEMSIRDLNRQMDWNLPDDVATTIAGLIIHEAETIPNVGQKFLFHSFAFKILKKRGNQVTMVRISPAKKGQAPSKSLKN
jgi:Mg2+/Co2+ transporter CorB